MSNNKYKITDELLTLTVSVSYSFMEVLRKLGIKEAGGSHSHYARRIRGLNVDISHFSGGNHNKGKKFPSRQRKIEDILVKREIGGRAKAEQLRRALVKSGITHKCSKCGQLPIWLGNELVLDVDHINEDWLDDRLENLRFLCPNCHSQFSRNLISESGETR